MKTSVRDGACSRLKVRLSRKGSPSGWPALPCAAMRLCALRRLDGLSRRPEGARTTGGVIAMRRTRTAVASKTAFATDATIGACIASPAPLGLTNAPVGSIPSGATVTMFISGVSAMSRIG
jgi:hypothetical protein